jgi:pimeloyl-ACP methyl ester carboxylesterase
MRETVVAMFLLLNACSSCDEPPRRRDAGVARPVVEQTPEEPPPPELSRESMAITAEDGTVLTGDLEWRTLDAPLVVLVHQLGSTRAEWEGLRRAIDTRYTTFAFDLRGHGESTAGGALDFSAFDNDEWAKLPGDLRAVLAALRAREGLSPPKVALVGSSIGSSAAIVAAADAETAVDVLVAISPGRAYHGIDALTPLTRLGERPILAIASPGDGPSAETAAVIARVASAGEEASAEGGAHGVRMFADDPASQDRVVAFLRAHLD